MAESNEDFLCIYVVYNCSLSPLPKNPEKPNRKQYQTPTTPQNCIISPLSNKPTIRCTACPGPNLWPPTGVMAESNEDFLCIYVVYNCILSPLPKTPEKPNRKQYQTPTTPQNCIISPLSNKPTIRCTACPGPNLWPPTGVMAESNEDFLCINCIYVVYNCSLSPLPKTPEKPNRKQYQTPTTPQKCIISLLSNKPTISCTACPGPNLWPPTGVMAESNEDFLCIYVVYNCSLSPSPKTLEKPNRKQYQTPTTPQNCIISPLSNKPTIRCTACPGPNLWPPTGVMAESNEDFLCIYVVYNCILSPLPKTPEKPNRKQYQTLTTPQNCIISPLSNKPTISCTACPGPNLWPPTGVMAESNEDFLCIYVVYNCSLSPLPKTLEKPNRKQYQTPTTPQNCIISPLSNKPTIRCTACPGPNLWPPTGVMAESNEDFLCIYVVYNCILSPLPKTPEKPNRKQYQTPTTPQNCIISPLSNKPTIRCTACPGPNLRSPTEVMAESNEDFLCIYVVYNCILSPLPKNPEKPNRKQYQTPTTPQNCIISPLSNKPTISCTACPGPILWPPTGVMAESNEDFLCINCIYVVYNCSLSPLPKTPEKPNRKQYQTPTTPQKCIISLLSNKPTISCTACPGPNLWPPTGVMAESNEDFLCIYVVYNCILSPLPKTPEKPNRKQYQTPLHHKIVSSLPSRTSPQSGAQLAQGRISGHQLRSWQNRTKISYVYTQFIIAVCHPYPRPQKNQTGSSIKLPLHHKIVSSLPSRTSPQSGAQLAQGRISGHQLGSWQNRTKISYV